MRVSLDLKKDKLLLKILNSPHWAEDKSRLDSISYRKWNPNDKVWELPISTLQEVIDKWEDKEILVKNPEIEDLIKDYYKMACNVRGSSISEDIQTAIPLKTYQEEYVRLSRTQNRMILALEQGLGKTIASLERAKVLGLSKLVIVCPKTVATNWRTEIYKVFSEESVIVKGTKAQIQKTIPKLKGAKFIICSYENVKYVKELADNIILDEAHLVSNPKSKRFKETKALLELNKSSNLQLLSGTPIQHKIRDLWALVHLIDPIFAGTRQNWINTYEQINHTITKEVVVRDKNRNILYDAYGTPKTRRIEIATSVTNKNQDLLRLRLKPILFRVSRDKFVDFKDRIDTVTVEMTKPQRDLYDKIKTEILIELEEKRLSIANAPTRMLRLLQASEGLFNFDKDLLDSGKLEYIKEYLDNTDEKVIVWSRFRAITEILGELYKDKSVVYNGGRTDNYKTIAKWAFNGVETKEDLNHFNELSKRSNFNLEPGGAQFFFGVINMRSSIGMNLHKYCNRQIFPSFDWMGNANFQAADRIRRLNQEADEVFTVFLQSEDTIDSKALDIILSNYNTSVGVLDGKSSLTYQQINELIKAL